MKRLSTSPACCVSFLTPILCIMLSGCSIIESRYGESCNSHAYSQAIVSDYITSRFMPESPVRVAVVPYSVPANISAIDNERPGLGNQLAWIIHRELINWGKVPIVEVLNRPDWPGKKEEFHTGNFGAIAAAREAGYDFVLVGYLDPQRSLDTATAYSKLIDVENGVTVYYGYATAMTRRPEMRDWSASLGLSKSRPDLQNIGELYDKLGWCVVNDMMQDKTVPD